MDNLEVVINGTKYTLRSANFFETKTQFQNLLSLAKEAITLKDNQVDIDIGQLLSNVGSDAFNGVENFILKYASVTNEDNRELLFKNRPDAEAHFNKHRGDYVELIFAGLKYHFLDFLPAGITSSAGMANFLASK